MSISKFKIVLLAVLLTTVAIFFVYGWNLALFDFSALGKKLQVHKLLGSVPHATKKPPENLRRRLGPLGNIPTFSNQNDDTASYSPPGNSLQQLCNMDTCINYSLCPLAQPLKFYLYPQTNSNNLTTAVKILHKTFSKNNQIVSDPNDACLFVAIVDKCNSNFTVKWHFEGRNHILWTYCSVKEFSKASFTPPKFAILASESFHTDFRVNFDIVISHWQNIPVAFGDSWKNIPQLFPVRRNYRASLTSCRGLQIISMLAEITDLWDGLSYKFVSNDDCKIQAKRRDVIRKSHFSLIFLPTDGSSIVSTMSVQSEIYECLRESSIPVIIGSRFMPAFSEVLDWSKVLITVPVGRLDQLPVLLDSIRDIDIASYRQQGRLFLQNYLGSVEKIVDTLVAILRTRLGMSPPGFGSVNMNVIHGAAQANTTVRLEEYVLKRRPSMRNHVINHLEKYESWNVHFQSFKNYPQVPWEEEIPLQTSGRLFPEDVKNETVVKMAKNDRPRLQERFTIVMLTYKRQHVLPRNLKRLNGLKYLHKIIVVWNELVPPRADFPWPNISVPIIVMFPKKNSLNNKFIPYDAIETEAVLTLDDEIQFEQEELLFGFHVWTENRDRLIGYMARYHSWDERHKSWHYTWTDACEISLTLTCGVFFHKMYMYKYTYEMPEVIRKTVDKVMNCDDLAMNFLIAHHTRKPPIKVTPKRKFHYPGVHGGISTRGNHNAKRHKCLNLFAQVYGYMPLRYTLMRADSMLYRSGVGGKFQSVCFKKV